jgi:hypothetical protein
MEALESHFVSHPELVSGSYRIDFQIPKLIRNDECRDF